MDGNAVIICMQPSFIAMDKTEVANPHDLTIHALGELTDNIKPFVLVSLRPAWINMKMYDSGDASILGLTNNGMNPAIDKHMMAHLSKFLSELFLDGDHDPPLISFVMTREQMCVRRMRAIVLNTISIGAMHFLRANNVVRGIQLSEHALLRFYLGVFVLE